MNNIDEFASWEDMFRPVHYTMNALSGKWKLPVLYSLTIDGAARYSAIKRKLSGVTNIMLTKSLKELEETGMVKREQFNEIPSRVEYSLTEKGKSFAPILTQLAMWGAENIRIDTDSGIKCRNCPKNKTLPPD